MITNEQNTFYCGDDDIVGIKIKIINPDLGQYSDCTFNITIGGNTYGEIDENSLISHDFIECGMLKADIEYIIKILKTKANILNICQSLDDYCVKNKLSKLMRYRFCDITENNTEITDSCSLGTLIFTDHDSMKDYFMVPFCAQNTFYVAVGKRYDNYIDFNCSDDYDWSLDELNYYKIDKDYFISILECAKKHIMDAMFK